jgi:hypoxanthine phosphoribosyltransferase
MNKKIIKYTYKNFIKDLNKLKLAEISDDIAGIICIMKGGFFLSYAMSNNLKLPIYYAHINSYEDQIKKNIQVKDINHIKRLSAKRYLVCEDVIDTGETILSLCNILPKSAELEIISLFAKTDSIKFLMENSNKIKSVERLNKLEEDAWVEFPWESW